MDRETAAMKNQSTIMLLAQKRVYQKHLRDLQQTTLAKDALALEGMHLSSDKNYHFSLHNWHCQLNIEETDSALDSKSDRKIFPGHAM